MNTFVKIEKGDAVILELRQPLGLDKSARGSDSGNANLLAVRETIVNLVNHGWKKILIDFRWLEEERIRPFDSSGIGELVRAFNVVDNAGGKLAVIGLNPHHKDIIEITKIHSIIPLCDTVDDALTRIAA